MHPQQDSFSHEGFNPEIGQLAAAGDNLGPFSSVKSINNEMRKYDKTTFDPEKAERMARDTFSKLLQARNLMETSKRFGTFRKPIQYSAIEKDVKAWARANSPRSKRAILERIRSTVDNYYIPASVGGGTSPGRKKRKTKVTVTVHDE